MAIPYYPEHYPNCGCRICEIRKLTDNGRYLIQYNNKGGYDLIETDSDSGWGCLTAALLVILSIGAVAGWFLHSLFY